MQISRKVDYTIFIIGYILSFVASRTGHYYISGCGFIIVGIGLYLTNAIRENQLANLRGIFSVSWIAGEGIASFQLSKLQTDWENITWICFFLAYFCFMLGYDLMEKRAAQQSKTCVEMQENSLKARKVLNCIVGIAIVSLLCFVLEATVVGFIPLFSPEPHAYSTFHISGVHYFTISCILIPGLSVLYSKIVESWNIKRGLVLIVGNMLAFAIPILCVSRFQLLFALGFAGIIYLVLYRHITWKMVLTAIVIVIPLYVLLTVARRHDVSYLNSIFEMKNANTPIFITQPYMYIANNYENFNCMVKQLTGFSKGIRMLFPIIALSGLKFVFPQLVSTPIYITKQELTTLTMFYDSYYDFGIIGVVLLAFILGAVALKLEKWIKTTSNPIAYLFYGQFAIYLGLSFFTTWFSNPTTWFWFIITGIMYIYVNLNPFVKILKGKKKDV